MSRSDGDKEYHCNWVAFSKAVHNIIKDIPTYDSEGRMLTPEDYRWAYAVKRLINTVFEPEGGERGISFFDKDIANETIKSELLRRKNNKLTP
tara:strand:+ start:475 stop:753 length:279 start_codon:yes stop_codon:yes gene_type:complete